MGLKDVLLRILDALNSAPSTRDFDGEELGRQWLAKYQRVLESLFKSAPFPLSVSISEHISDPSYSQLTRFELLRQQLAERPPRLHKVDNHLQKLGCYLVKFEDLLSRLEVRVALLDQSRHVLISYFCSNSTTTNASPSWSSNCDMPQCIELPGRNSPLNDSADESGRVSGSKRDKLARNSGTR